MPSDMMYDFSQDVNGTSYRVTSPIAATTVSYLNASAPSRHSTTTDTVSLAGIWPGVDVREVLGTYSVSSHFTLQQNRELRLDFELDETVVPHAGGSGITSFIDARGRTAFVLIVGSPTDDTGMSGPPPNVVIEGAGSHWTATVTIDDRWATESSRVTPLSLDVDVSLTPLYALAQAMNRVSMAAVSQRRVYWDPQPDSATQFAVEFFDDAGYLRPRPLIGGVPVCSTVPYGVGDTSDMTEAEVAAWTAGLGGPSRTVYLQIIASKKIAVDKTVYYDVELPGTVDYLHHVAQPAGFLGSLPIYHGSFVINTESPPSFVDGGGTVRAYVAESRTKSLYARITVHGTGADSVTGRLVVEPLSTGGWSMNNLPCLLSVHGLNLKSLPGKLTVKPLPPYGNSIWNLPAKITVIVIPSNLFYYDPLDEGWNLDSSESLNYSADGQYDTVNHHWPWGGTEPEGEASVTAIPTGTDSLAINISEKNTCNFWYIV